MINLKRQKGQAETPFTRASAKLKVGEGFFKGQAETPFILSMAILFTLLLFVGGSILVSYPTVTFVTGWDIAVFAGTIIGVAAACAIVTGIPCAAALIVANLISFIVASNTIIYTLIFLPLSITTAYVTARLGRGGG